MIIIVSWYSDGSATPEVRGFPETDERWSELMRHMKYLTGAAKDFRAFRVGAYGTRLIELGLLGEGDKEDNPF